MVPGEEQHQSFRDGRARVAGQPNSETERWPLLPYRVRVKEMMEAPIRNAEWLNVKQHPAPAYSGADAQPVQLHCVPDNFSIPESKKFGSYILMTRSTPRIQRMPASSLHSEPSGSRLEHGATQGEAKAVKLAYKTAIRGESGGHSGARFA